MGLLAPLSARRLCMQGPEYGGRAENREFFARAQIAQCLVQGFCIFNFCPRNCEMGVDLAAIAPSIPRQIHQMRVQQPGIAAEFEQRALDGRICGARQFVCANQNLGEAPSPPEYETVWSCGWTVLKSELRSG